MFTSPLFLLSLVPFLIGLATGRWWALPLAVASVLFIAFAFLSGEGDDMSYELSIRFILVFAFFFAFSYLLIPLFWATVGVGVHRGIRQAWLGWRSASQ